MKKASKIVAIVAIVAVVFSLAACKKSRYCHCITTEGKPDTVVVNIDRDMRCNHILEMGFERRINGQVEVTVQKVSCHELDEDTVATIPQWTEEE